jgi:hypothetical protein
MKRRNSIGILIAVFLILCVPVSTAIQIQTINTITSTSNVSYEMLTTMNAEELSTFIQSVAIQYPHLLKQFQRSVQTIKNTPASMTETRHRTSGLSDASHEPQPRDDNQTFLEKIFWKIYNYRVFRLVISVILFLKYQSKFTLWRTMTWGIKLLRLTKLGILLGYIDPQQTPQTPSIVFEQDLVNATLTVASVSPDDVLWGDITEIGNGSCDPLPPGNVAVGDTLTHCQGIIVLWYLPRNEVIGVFEFD